MRYSPVNYTSSQLDALRIIALVSSSASIISCLIAFYTYLAVRPSRKKFRHQLIMLLIIFDFLKALAALLYPALSLARDTTEIGPGTINFLGFFTALSVEGGDLAILSFAIHTLLTIFYPQRTGGLHCIRYYIYGLSFFGPIILASLAFINDVGYVEMDVWCYLPEKPKWFRLALSWGPRYGIMLAILIIYCTIYFYIISQVKKLENHKHVDHARQEANEANFNVNLDFGNEERLKTRYKVIAKQIKIVFLYPIAYFVIWFFPLVSNCLRLELKSNLGISIIVAFMQPFNGVVDTMVYLIREKPWNLTYSQTPKSPSSPHEKIPKWRKYVQWLPLYSLPDESGSSTPVPGAVLMQYNNSDLLNPEEFLKIDKDMLTSVEILGTSNYTSSNIKSDGRSVDSAYEIDMLDFLNDSPRQ